MGLIENNLAGSRMAIAKYANVALLQSYFLRISNSCSEINSAAKIKQNIYFIAHETIP